MKSFLIQSIAFFAFQTAIFGLLLTLHDRSTDTNYLAATCEKHERLDRAPGPRLVLIGGSNLAFGIDSERLGNALQREVVNMGLAAGLGIDFMLNEIEPSLKPGDWVLLGLEYDRLSGGYNPLTLRQIIECRPESVFYLEPRQWNRVLLRGGLSIIGGIARRSLGLYSTANSEPSDSPAYLRNGFNRWGDLESHHGLPSTFHASSLEPALTQHPDWIPDEPIVSTLRAFADRCQRKGIAFLYSCPPQPPGIHASEVETLGSIIDRLKTIPNLQLLDRPEDHVYPEAFFFDTGYHLTQEGTRLRTDTLIEKLEAVSLSTNAKQ